LSDGANFFISSAHWRTSVLLTMMSVSLSGIGWTAGSYGSVRRAKRASETGGVVEGLARMSEAQIAVLPMPTSSQSQPARRVGSALGSECTTGPEATAILPPPTEEEEAEEEAAEEEALYEPSVHSVAFELSWPG
jgi:hypothetical protein